jgi:hypothetical protein
MMVDIGDRRFRVSIDAIVIPLSYYVGGRNQHGRRLAWPVVTVRSDMRRQRPLVSSVFRAARMRLSADRMSRAEQEPPISQEEGPEPGAPALLLLFYFPPSSSSSRA